MASHPSAAAGGDVELAPGAPSVSLSIGSNGAASPAAAVEVNPSAYLDFLRKFRAVWREQPDVCISYADLAYTVSVPVTDTKVGTLASVAADLVKRPFKGSGASTILRALQPSSGVIRPGSMTLVLAPPGHGKTLLLKALSGRLSHDKCMAGEVRYNNATAAENLARGVHVSRLCAYVGQQDLLFPVLTVTETLQFAARSSLPDARLLKQDASFSAEQQSLVDEVVTLDSQRAELLIQLLGLSECANTIVGNELLRGVSGGQKKRVNLGEMLLTNARAFFLDEVSTGLDAAVALHIFSALKQVCALHHTSVVTALLQPTPETYALFDDIILLRDGHTVFHGPREEIPRWLWEVAGLEVPQGVDEAEFLVDFLSDPQAQYERVDKIMHACDDVDAKLQGTAEASRLGQQQRNVPALTQVSSRPANHGSSDGTQTPSVVRIHYMPPVEVESEPRLSSQESVLAETPPAPVPIPVPVLSALAAPEEGRAKALRSDVSNSFAPQYHCNAQASPAYDSEELAVRFHASPMFAALQTEVGLVEKAVQPLDPSAWSAYTRAQYGQAFPHSSLKHTRLNLQRQHKLTVRNKTMVPPRIAQALVLGLVFGTLFVQLAYDKFADRMGLILCCIMTGAFANLTELPVAEEARNVVAKQIDAGFFPSFSYSASVSILHVPITLVETLIFASLIYWLSGFDSSAERFFFFLLVLFLNSNALSVLFRTISYVASNPDVARQMDMPFIIISIIFGGFLIVYDKIPKWLLWLYYMSPFGWGVRSLALNEFGSSKYDRISNPAGSLRDGDVFLSAFGIFTDPIWLWMGPLFLAGFYLFFLSVNTMLLGRLKPVTPMGTRKAAPTLTYGHGHDTSAGAGATNERGTIGEPSPIERAPASFAALSIEVQPRTLTASKTLGAGGAKHSFQLSALPFKPVTLAWLHINYSVDIVSQHSKGSHRRQLLKEISGFAAPGHMTALMGSSGAGKTTLMDVIAGRKTVGYIEGEILVNGFPKNSRSFDKLCGYVEQADIHIGTATVREALLFSAKLRLPVSVSAHARETFCDEVMQLVGLSHIAGRLVGDAALPGLSQGQLKLVTIAVELVANPSVIFLDEPTSGLDAPSAARVMKAVRRIAATGRTVLCTIHQPSEELFFYFDRLLLLKSGGEDVYQADLGRKGSQLASYFEEASGGKERLPKGGTEVMPDGKKQVTDVIGAAGQQSAAEQVDYASIWRASKLHAATSSEIASAATPCPNAQPIVLAEEYASNFTRWKEVQYRLFTSHWRNPAMNLTRLLLLLVFSLMLGTVYYKMDTSDYGGVASLLSVTFLGLSFPASLCAASALPTFFRQRAVYYRETTIGLYGYQIFNAAIFLTELPYLCLCTLTFLAPFYFMIGFKTDASLFFQFYLMCLLMVLCYSAFSLLWLALLPNLIAANVANGVVMNLCFMFGGLFIKPSSMPEGWKWFYYIDPVPKAFLSVTMGQFYCDTNEPGNVCPTIKAGPQTPLQPTYDYLTGLLEAHAGDFPQLLGWLILEVVVIRIFVLLALKYVSHIKR